MLSSQSQPALLIAANSFWNIINFRGRLIEALHARGHRVIVIAPPAGPRPTHDLPADVEWLSIDSDGLNPIADTLLIGRLHKLLRKFRPAAYLSFTPKPNIYGALAARLAGVPAIPNVSGLGTAFIRGGPLQLLVSTLYRAAFARSPAVFFQNPEDLDWFVCRRLVQAGQARLLPGSGVDLAHFEARPLPSRRAGECVFLFIGRLLGDKGVREFAEAARRVRQEQPNARFQLLGFAEAENRSAITREELDRWVTEGWVEYLGSTTDVRPFLADADAVVLPSYREGLPRSLLEAGAVGRPLLASDVPGNRHIVTHGLNGLLFPVRSAEALAGACLDFMDLPESERRRMGEASRRRVEADFSEERVIAAYLNVLAEILGKRDRARTG